MRTLLLIVFCGSLLTVACSKKKAPAGAAMVRVKLGYQERGIASWYGNPYHGRATASGEIYDMERLTAAHPRLPFGVTTRVENLQNGKTVDVKINDRGPFVRGRIIDLSRAAARQIDLLGPGITRVRIRVIAAPAKVRASGDIPNSRFGFLLRPLLLRPCLLQPCRPLHNRGEHPEVLALPVPSNAEEATGPTVVALPPLAN